MTDDMPDTNQILADLDRAQTRVRGYLRELGLGLGPAGVGPMFTGKLANAVEVLLDQWAYLRHCLEAEHAPLPDVWKHAGAAGDTTELPGGPDEQLGYLRRAIVKTSDWLESRPEDGDNPVDAMVDHLVACAAAVDAMCSEGILPSAWAPDPRVTANGGAAAKAGWNLPSPDKTIGPCHVELMGHRVRVGVVSEVTLFGEPFLRIDFPQDSESSLPEFYRPAAVYAITPDPPAREFPSAIASGPNPDWEDPF
jgi:hypothetical protein